MGPSASQPDLFAALRAIALKVGDYAVFGSGPLIVRGIIPLANDVDVVSRGLAWSQACALGTMVRLDDHDVEVVSFLDGRITVGRTWAYGAPNIDDLIDSAETIDDLPFVRLEHVVAYKEIAGRPKDLDHLEALRQWELSQ
ncbi:MAG: hypothetical protein ACR2NG_03465 [Acidimicrobiia bacterium]